ncbi:MAG: YeeE/YedE thiosulfate transporter family protein [Hyphomicrobiaceae bacterium]
MLGLLALLAFLVGFSVHRGTNCSVVAARQLARRRDPTRMTSFIAGAAIAMALVMPLVWAHPETFKAASSFTLTWAPVVGGAFYGLGALVNGACALGTLVRISEGRIAFLATFPGICLGGYLAIRFNLASFRGEPVPAVMATSGAPQIAAVISAAIIAVAALHKTTSSLERARYGLKSLLKAARWRPIMSMLITGSAAGLAFSITDAWAWPALMRRVAQVAAGAPPDFPAALLIGPVALLGGGFAASWVSGRLRLRVRGYRQAVQSFAGGIIMGLSAALIPGGNDVMLLHDLPSLALSGIVAYAAMFAVLVPTLALMRKLKTVPSP